MGVFLRWLFWDNWKTIYHLKCRARKKNVSKCAVPGISFLRFISEFRSRRQRRMRNGAGPRRWRSKSRRHNDLRRNNKPSFIVTVVKITSEGANHTMPFISQVKSEEEKKRKERRRFKQRTRETRGSRVKYFSHSSDFALNDLFGTTFLFKKIFLSFNFPIIFLFFNF